MASTAKRKGGRPRIFKESDADGGYISAHIRGDQMRFISRLVGHAGGQKAAGLRQVLDAGIAALKKRAGR
jgi:hypothetical protein